MSNSIIPADSQPYLLVGDDEIDGSGSSAAVNSSREHRYCFGRLTYKQLLRTVAVGSCITVLGIILLIIFAGVIPNTIRTAVNDATFSISDVKVDQSSPSGLSISVHGEITSEHSSMIKLDKTTMNVLFGKSKIGTLDMPELTFGQHQTKFVMPGELSVSDGAAFDAFMVAFVLEENVKWTLEATTTAEHVESIHEVAISKEVAFRGLNGLKKLVLESYSIGKYDQVARGFHVNGIAILDNPSTFDLGSIGDLRLDLSLPKTPIFGYISCSNVSLSRGTSRCQMSGFLFSSKSSSSIESFLNSYVSGDSSPVVLSSSTPFSSSIYNRGLDLLRINSTLPSQSQRPMLLGISSSKPEFDLSGPSHANCALSSTVRIRDSFQSIGQVTLESVSGTLRMLISDPDNLQNGAVATASKKQHIANLLVKPTKAAPVPDQPNYFVLAFNAGLIPESAFTGFMADLLQGKDTRWVSLEGSIDAVIDLGFGKITLKSIELSTEHQAIAPLVRPFCTSPKFDISTDKHGSLVSSLRMENIQNPNVATMDVGAASMWISFDHNTSKKKQRHVFEDLVMSDYKYAAGSIAMSTEGAILVRNSTAFQVASVQQLINLGLKPHQTINGSIGMNLFKVHSAVDSIKNTFTSKTCDFSIPSINASSLRKFKVLSAPVFTFKAGTNHSTIQFSNVSSEMHVPEWMSSIIPSSAGLKVASHEFSVSSPQLGNLVSAGSLVPAVAVSVSMKGKPLVYSLSWTMPAVEMAKNTTRDSLIQKALASKNATSSFVVNMKISPTFSAMITNHSITLDPNQSLDSSIHVHPTPHH